MPSKLDKQEVAKARIGPRELKDPHSKEYAIQTLYSLKQYIESAKIDESRIQRELGIIEKYRHWEVLGYSSKEEMMTAELSEPGQEVVRKVSKAAQARAMKSENPQMRNADIARELETTPQVVGQACKRKKSNRKNVYCQPTIKLAKDPTRTASNIIKKMGADYAAKLKEAL